MQPIQFTTRGPLLNSPEAFPVVPSGPFKGLPSIDKSSGEFSSGNPYIFCNEQGCDSSLEVLAQLPKNDPHAAYVGFSCEFNWNAIAVTRPALAIICDIDKNTLELYQKLQEIVLATETPKAFIEKFQKYLLTKDWLPGLDFQMEAEKKGSWLSTVDGYHYVRQMHIDGKILYGCLNIEEKKNQLFEKIAAWLQDNNLYVQTLYVSNILEWMRKSSRYAFDQAVSNIKTLSGNKTHCVHAYCLDESGEVFPTQHVLAPQELDRLEEVWNVVQKRPVPKGLREGLQPLRALNFDE